MSFSTEDRSKRLIYLFWLLDTSASMYGDKIKSLNQVIKDSIPLLQKEFDKDSEINLMVRVVKFSDKAEWVLKDAVVIDEFEWKDLKTEGKNTSMGSALNLLADFLNKMQSDKGYRPLIILLTDGHATDDFAKGVEELNRSKWGKVATKIAIGIGKDVDEDALKKFVGETGLYIPVSNATDFINAFKWSCFKNKSMIPPIINKTDKFEPVIPTPEYELDENDNIWNDEDWW